MKTESKNETSLSNANGRTDESLESNTENEEMEPASTACPSSQLMLGLLDEFTQIYKDKLERLENSSLKMEEKNYLQTKVSLLERWLGELGEQNAVLVRTLGELEGEAATRVSILQDSLRTLQPSCHSTAEALTLQRQQVLEALAGREAAEGRVLQLTEQLQLCQTYNCNLRADVDTLLHVVSRASRDGDWRLDDIALLSVSPEQLLAAGVPVSGSTTPSCGLKGSMSPSVAPCTDPFPRLAGASETRSSLSDVQTDAADDSRRCSADQAELQLSVNIDALAARLADAERECEAARAEASRLRGECEAARAEASRLRGECETARAEASRLRGECAVLRERASETELSHETCDAAVQRLHRELHEALRISRELQEQITSRSATPLQDAEAVSEKSILVRELQGHLATARHECALRDATVTKLERQLVSVRAQLCERQERSEYLEQQLVQLQQQLARAHSHAQQLAQQVVMDAIMVVVQLNRWFSLAGGST
ncbi:uncharacterized protein LOC125177830 [Hyalella azteca]|uniref:Uncharacterized protein LOC125177830 n=1 Tax=Hyalella azteca TaxID=294128 RepID=A0A979FI62_HYAAZ|nr:uncharacterized protein LOC125177830 [Hyalella azteca]